MPIVYEHRYELEGEQWVCRTCGAHMNCGHFDGCPHQKDLLDAPAFPRLEGMKNRLKA